MEFFYTREMEKTGQFIFILYKQDAPIQSDKVYFFLDFKTNEGWEEYDIGRKEIGEGKHFGEYLYRFREPGNYRVTALSANMDTLGSAELELLLPDFELGAEYYREAKIVACEDFANGEPLRPGTEFTYQTTESEPVPAFRLFLNLEKQLLTDIVVLDTWKWDGEGFNDYQGEAKYRVNSNWDYTQFPVTVNGPGRYQLFLFTNYNVFIGKIQVEVK